MIREIHKFVASDKSEWFDRKSAEKREKLIDAILVLMKPLGPMWKDDGCKFANGEGFIQHDKFEIAKVKMKLVKLAAEVCNEPKWLETKVNFHNLGRMLDDSDSPLYSAWGRLINIDEQGREWGQAYYANNPHEATYVKLR